MKHVKKLLAPVSSVMILIVGILLGVVGVSVSPSGTPSPTTNQFFYDALKGVTGHDVSTIDAMKFAVYSKVIVPQGMREIVVDRDYPGDVKVVHTIADDNYWIFNGDEKKWYMIIKNAAATTATGTVHK